MILCIIIIISIVLTVGVANYTVIRMRVYMMRMSQKACIQCLRISLEQFTVCRANRMLSNELMQERVGQRTSSSSGSIPGQMVDMVPAADYEAVVFELTKRKMDLAEESEKLTMIRRELHKEREKNESLETHLHLLLSKRK